MGIVILIVGIIVMFSVSFWLGLILLLLGLYLMGQDD